MKVLFVASEAVPFIKTGGLADVVGSLPKELNRQSAEVKIIIPKYSNISEKFKKNIITKKEFNVPVGWRKQYCGLCKLKYNPVYFIDNEYYFKRDQIYGQYDEAERFSFFCRGVLESLKYMNFKPDILHCHDWHTGLISVFLKTHYQNNKSYQKLRTLFTIHNLKYQGNFSPDVLQNVLGLGNECFTTDKLEFNNQVSFMKGGIVYSDLISTVSNTYAQEIKTEFYGENLDGLLRAKSEKLSGIVNGIDYKSYNPASDANLIKTYHKKAIAQKQESKINLQKMLGLPVKKHVPLIAIVSRLVSQKGLDLVNCVLDEILNLDLQVVVLGTGEGKYENAFRHAASRYPSKISVNLLFDESIAHKIYAGSDIYLMPSLYEPCGISQLIALRYGSVPIVRETGGLKDTVFPYNEANEEGNGFTFKNYNAHDMLYTIKRAISFYQKPDIWQKIITSGMNSNYSWQYSAKKYIELYQKLLDINEQK